jgi:hypothetical protein
VSVKVLFGVACCLTGVLWVASLAAAVHVLLERGESLWHLMREPAVAGVIATASVALVVWRVSAPLGVVWRVAYRCGREDAASLDDDGEGTSGTVIPFQSRQTSYY